MTKVVITGSCGYIGGALTERLWSEGFAIRRVDNHTGKVVAHLRQHRGTDFTEGELDYLEGADLVVHLAAVSGIDRVSADPREARRVNVTGTRLLAVTAKKRRVPMLFASSLAVAGSKEDVNETTPAAPESEYAKEKAEGERIVADAGGTIVRMTNVFGRARVGSRSFTKGTVVDKFMQAARDMRPIQVYGNGDQVRNYIHVDDAVELWIRAIRRAASQRGEPGERWLFAGPSSLAVNTIAGLVRHRYQWADIRHESSPRRGEVAVTELRADATLTYSKLGFRPGIGVGEYIQRG